LLGRLSSQEEIAHRHIAQRVLLGAPGLKHGSVNQFLSARKVDDQPKKAVAVDVLASSV